MENNIKKNSDAKIRANAKYSQSHYKNISIKVKPENAEKIRNIAEKYNISIAQLIIKSIDYIANNDIVL